MSIRILFGDREFRDGQKSMPESRAWVDPGGVAPRKQVGAFLCKGI